MSETRKRPEHEPGLNPALRQRTEQVHDTSRPTLPPADSASVQHEEGRAWPMVWLVAAILGLVLGIWLIF